MGKYSGDDAENEIVDAQFAADSTRLESIRPTVVQLVYKLGRAQDWRAKYMITRGLIVTCLPHVSSSVREKANEILAEEEERFSDFVPKHQNMHDAGNDWGIIQEADFMERLPYIEKVWGLLQHDLGSTNLLQWATTSIEGAIEGQMLNRLMEDLEAADFERNLKTASTPVFPSSNEEVLEREKLRSAKEVTALPKGEELPDARSSIPPLIDSEITHTVKPKSAPIGPRLEGQDHASYMREQMAALHDEVEHLDDWRTGEEPVPVEKIEESAEKIKTAIRKGVLRKHSNHTPEMSEAEPGEAAPPSWTAEYPESMKRDLRKGSVRKIKKGGAADGQ